jgi:hypothetical protein
MHSFIFIAAWFSDLIKMWVSTYKYTRRRHPKHHNIKMNVKKKR